MLNEASFVPYIDEYDEEKTTYLKVNLTYNNTNLTSQSMYDSSFTLHTKSGKKLEAQDIKIVTDPDKKAVTKFDSSVRSGKQSMGEVLFKAQKNKKYELHYRESGEDIVFEIDTAHLKNYKKEAEQVVDAYLSNTFLGIETKEATALLAGDLKEIRSTMQQTIGGNAEELFDALLTEEEITSFVKDYQAVLKNVLKPRYVVKYADENDVIVGVEYSYYHRTDLPSHVLEKHFVDSKVFATREELENTKKFLKEIKTNRIDVPVMLKFTKKDGKWLLDEKAGLYDMLEDHLLLN